MKFFIFFVLFLFCLSGCQEEQYTGPLPPAFLVLIESSTGGNRTGFWIDDHTVLTAAHSIPEGDTSVWVTYLTGATMTTIEAKIKSINYDSDFMVLKTSVQGGPVLAWCDADMGDDVYTYRWSSLGTDYIEGRIVSETSKKYLSTLLTEPGYSGSPIIKGDCVVAMNKGRLQHIDLSVEIIPE